MTRRRLEKALMETAQEEGAERVELTHTGSGHYRLRIFVGDEHRLVFFSGTPSDHRAFLNFRTTLRHAIHFLHEHEHG